MPHSSSRSNYRAKRRLSRLALDPALLSLRRSLVSHGISWRTEWGAADPTAAEAILRAAFGADWRWILYLARSSPFPVESIL